MFSSFFLSLREGLEAALILGILLGALRQVGRRDLKAFVWAGAGIAVLLSLVTALLLTRLGLGLEGRAEVVFEAVTMLLAAAVLTWVIFWMGRRAGNMKQHLETGVHQASGAGKWPLFGLAFLAVLREGVELALFLAAAAFASDARQALLGALSGLLTAALLGGLLFATTVRLNLRRFFQVTGVLLILFAAGLVAHGVHELNELGWVPALIEPLWNLNLILDDHSAPGQVLAALFGYNGDPSLSEVLAYAAYISAVTLGLWGRRKAVRKSIAA